MPVEQVKPNIVSHYRANNIQPRKQPVAGAQSVSFQGGFNPVVGLMDFIAAGGYAASFCIQDGLGFIAPRVHHGLTNGGKEKRDENGNTVLDKNGNPNVSAAIRAAENKAKIAGLYSRNNMQIGTIVQMSQITVDGEQLKLSIGEDFLG